MPSCSTAGAVVDAAALIKSGIVRRAKDGHPSSGQRRNQGQDQFRGVRRLQSAVEAVEKAGGSVKILGTEA